MASSVKTVFLKELTRRFGTIRKLARSQSLYEIGEGQARVYIRYSMRHGQGRTFYGLRQEDLHALEGYASFICFLWDDQTEPLFVPYAEYEGVFGTVNPAPDGAYKVQLFLRADGIELYIPHAGRFNTEGYIGWHHLEAVLRTGSLEVVPDFTHSQVQTLLGSIGNTKNYHVWVPPADRIKLDWSLVDHFECQDRFPHGFDHVKHILEEVDVIWLQPGSSQVRALFEVEHSTPIYSALLRFNDIHLVAPTVRPTFSVVANEARRDLFVRQLSRPTFQSSGLSELCTFLEYANVYSWYKRVTSE